MKSKKISSGLKKRAGTTIQEEPSTYVLCNDWVDRQALENRAQELLGRLADGGLGLLEDLGGVGLVCVDSRTLHLLRKRSRGAGLGLLLAALGVRHGGSVHVALVFTT